MSETVRIEVAALVGSGLCVASEDGDVVHEAIVPALKAGKRVEISFRDVEDVTSAFLNAAVGQLYGEFSEDTIRTGLSVVNMAQEDLQTLKRCVDRAKEYFKDPDRFHVAATESLGDDE